MFDAPRTNLIGLEILGRRRISGVDVADVVDVDGTVRIAFSHHRAAMPASFGAGFAAGFGAPERREHDRGEAQGFAPPSEVRP